jgi:hypothetical protein
LTETDQQQGASQSQMNNWVVLGGEEEYKEFATVTICISDDSDPYHTCVPVALWCGCHWFHYSAELSCVGITIVQEGAAVLVQIDHPRY